MTRSAWRGVVVLAIWLTALAAGPAAAQNPSVAAANPSSGAQDTVGLLVKISGKNFAPGARSDFFLPGTTDTGGITVRSTTVISSTEVDALIDISPTATVSRFDIKVTNTNGRSGKGSDLFGVTLKSAGQQACDVNVVKLTQPPIVLNTAPPNAACSATSGALDCTFGTAGLATTAIKQQNNVKDSALQADGKVLVLVNADVLGSGVYDTYVVRYNADGSRDMTFGSSGIAPAPLSSLADGESAAGIAVQADGRIVVAGWVPQKSPNGDKVAVVRLLSTGAVDTSFGSSGTVLLSFGSTRVRSRSYDVQVQADGRIVVAGDLGDSTHQFAIARLIPSGAIDSSFGSSGKLILTVGQVDTYTHAYAIGFQNWAGAQYPIVAGSTTTCLGGEPQIAVVRLLPSGALDATFGPAGNGQSLIDLSSRNDYANDITVDAGNQIVIGGNSGAYLMSARLLPNGTVDASYGSDGASAVGVLNLANAYGRRIAVDGSGRPVVAGYAGTSDFTQVYFLTVRFLSTGAPDASFGGSGATITTFGLPTPSDRGEGIVIEPSGRIVVAGDSRNQVVAGLAGYVP